MRVAALYDIHGNLPALEAVMDGIDQSHIDVMVVGGDVLPGPMPGEVLDALLNAPLPVRFIYGNGERDVLDVLAGRDPVRVPQPVRHVIRWTAQRISPKHAATIAAWPGTTSLDVPGIGPVLFCHATPRDDNEVFTRETAEARVLPLFENLGARVVVCGHTHMQFDRMVGGVRVLNAGSVGMPFGSAGAYWLELRDRDFRLQKTEYDLDAAAARMSQTDYPDVNTFVAKYLLEPPSEQAMLAAFKTIEIGWGEYRR